MHFIRRIVYLCVVWSTSLLMLAHAQSNSLSVPLRVVPNRFSANANTACGGDIPGNVNTYFEPVITTAGGLWFGNCNRMTDIVTFNSTDGSFAVLNSSVQYGSHFQFAADSSNANPIIIPTDKVVQQTPYRPDWNPVGKLQTNSLTWQSYGNSTGCTSTYSSAFRAYSAATDTFYSEDCSTYRIRMRAVASAVDQFLDISRECLSDTSYMCVAPTVWNDGTTDHLFWVAQAGTSKPTKIVRQSVLHGGPLTNVTIVGTDAPNQTSPICINSGGSVTLQVHPNGKMLFGACADGGLFYVDLSDPSTTQTIRRVSTCTDASASPSTPLIVTASRVYVACKLQSQTYYTYLMYPLSVSSSGIVSLSSSNSVNLTPASCSSGLYSAAVAASSVSGRPDAIWISCHAVGLHSNICGFGNALTVAAAGDTYACTPCPSGSYQNSFSFTADKSCTACPAGTYLASPTDSNCTYCAAGTYQSSTSATSCTACASGTYQPAAGSVSCLNCTTGVDTTFCPTPITPALSSSSQFSPSLILISVLLVASVKAFTL